MERCRTKIKREQEKVLNRWKETRKDKKIDVGEDGVLK